jgi:hypothetical protein
METLGDQICDLTRVVKGGQDVRDNTDALDALKRGRRA